MSETENLKEKLFRKTTTGWEEIEKEKKEEIFLYCSKYMEFLNKSKTEREIIKSAKEIAEANRFKNIREYETLKSLNMNLDDLQEMLRGCNFYSFDQVAYAIIETNGKMSVIPTSENAPVTAQDLTINNPPPQLPSVVISDGKLIQNKMEEQNLDKNNIKLILSKLKIAKLKDIVVMSIDADDKMYYQKKGENFIVIENYKKKLKLNF